MTLFFSNTASKTKLRTDLDWAAVKAERDAGASPAELAKKYAVSLATIYARTRREGASVDEAVNGLVRKVAREHRQMVQRRRWAVETAMYCADELTADQRIELAKKIDAYIYGDILE